MDAMQEASDKLVFNGDFAAFCKTGSDVKTTICDVRMVEITRLGHRLKIVIEADRYLRNMVRAIVGTLIEVGKGKMTQDQFKHVIASCDRSQAGKSAPACGLYLARVVYPEETFTPIALPKEH